LVCQAKAMINEPFHFKPGGKSSCRFQFLNPRKYLPMRR
jgi:hypothetical protein